MNLCRVNKEIILNNIINVVFLSKIVVVIMMSMIYYVLICVFKLLIIGEDWEFVFCLRIKLIVEVKIKMFVKIVNRV